MIETKKLTVNAMTGEMTFTITETEKMKEEERKKLPEEEIEELKVKQKETEESINFLMEDALSREL
ncbi:hypothetical protein K5V21_06035 [Clostridium sardiniense]|uniref:Uncharacterized protein n=1 Tax=Clostridium sardiniense TaxID=29369 RepID=A0ABS7KWN3_CLOSR|nr:hypothetical protein [Clostridium sardiniense]MBY0755013.1 hypothetical protein [Clostridium sardiniense]MDQ0459133.1 membrane protein involved in colicin uptake [Clostridium sardiniense]